MIHRFALIFLTVIGTNFGMEKPPKHRTVNTHDDKPGSHIRYAGSAVITHQPKPASSKGVLVRSTTKRLASDLIDAVKNGQYDRVKALLAGNARVNPEITDDTQETPLFAAITAPTYHDKILARLLEAGADPNQKVRGIAPVTQALSSKSTRKAVLRLLYAGVKTHEKIVLDSDFLADELFYEIKKQRVDRIKQLLKLNAPVNIRTKKDTTDNGERETPLLCTIDVPKKFNRDIFEEIVAIADINFCAQNGLSPIHKAVLWNNEEAARLLVLKDADTETTVPFYQEKSLTILQLAERMKMTELVKTINSLKLSKSALEEKVKEKIDKDELVAQLVRQTTPRRTKSPRAEVPKP